MCFWLLLVFDVCDMMFDVIRWMMKSEMVTQEEVRWHLFSDQKEREAKEEEKHRQYIMNVNQGQCIMNVNQGGLFVVVCRFTSTVFIHHQFASCRWYFDTLKTSKCDQIQTVVSMIVNRASPFCDVRRPNILWTTVKATNFGPYLGVNEAQRVIVKDEIRKHLDVSFWWSYTSTGLDQPIKNNTNAFCYSYVRP